MSDSPDVAEHIARALAEAEGARRSPLALVLHSVASVALIAVLGVQASPLIAGEWAVFVLACVAYRWFDARPALRRAVNTVTDTSPRLLVLALIYLSDSPASPLWGLAVSGGLSLTPRSEAQHHRQRLVLRLGHGALIAALAAQGHFSAAVLALIALSSTELELSVMHGMLGHSVRARAEHDVLRSEIERRLTERDRVFLARDLHDGIGAELTALLLRVRRGASGSEASERTQRILDQLRQAVRILRAGKMPGDLPWP